MEPVKPKTRPKAKHPVDLIIMARSEHNNSCAPVFVGTMRRIFAKITKKRVFVLLGVSSRIVLVKVYMNFSDSCKFLHDRSDYKHGWEIERDWQKQQEDKKNPKEEDYTIHSDED
jgi:hypothetical protein